MTTNLPRKRRSGKPSKPHPDFPLTANGNGQWSKKIRGKVYYFGRWDDADAALKRYLDSKDDLLAGRQPKPAYGFTLKDLCNHFLTAKQRQLDTGEITDRTFNDYHRVCERLLKVLDGNRLAESIDPTDFGLVRDELVKKMGTVALGNEISRIRVIFNFAYNDGHIDRPVRFGSVFKRPSKTVLRRQRKDKGLRMFEASEIRALLEATSTQVKAMILLGINCGFGNTDCATLPKTAIDLQAQWVDFARPKTGIDRRCPLWNETVDALKEAIKSRPDAKQEADESLVFLTKYGQRWVRTKPSKKQPGKVVAMDSVAQEIRKAVKALGLRSGRNFYALRHTFETVGGESRDQVAVDHIMGHVREDMASLYREKISDTRLVAVTQHVQHWLLNAD